MGANIEDTMTDKNANVQGIDFYQRRFAVTIV